MRYLILVPYLLSCVAASPSLSEEGYVYETIDKTLGVSPGGSLSLENMNGNIDVTVWEEKKVHIVAKKRAKGHSDGDARSILEETEIRITQSGNDVTVRTKRKERNFGSGRGLSVRYTITVPRKFDVDLETVNGNIKVVGVEGRAETETVNGKVNLAEIHGTFDASSVNGNIRADLTDSGGTEPLNAQTVNGGIRVILPKEFGARVKAQTVNGSIHTDFRSR